MKFDQDLCLNLFELWQAEISPRVRFAFGIVLVIDLIRHLSIHTENDCMQVSLEKMLNFMSVRNCFSALVVCWLAIITLHLAGEL